MIRWSGIALIAISILHIVILGIDAAPAVPAWLRFDLWTLEHCRPTPEQSPGMLAHGVRFWGKLGSFAAPTMILGALVVWLDRRGQTPPAFVAWALLAWSALATLVIEPSGFPLGILAALCLLVGIARSRKRGV